MIVFIFIVTPNQIFVNDLMPSTLLLEVSKPNFFAILGHDISYFVSPVIHTATFETTKLRNSYSLIDIKDITEVSKFVFTCSK